MTDQMLEEQNMMNPEESPKPRLQCFSDMDRTCGPDCMAYLTTPPAGRDYLEKPWANCHLLVTEHQKAKHLVILANVASREPAASSNLPRASGRALMLPVHLVGLNQRFDFSSGTISNVLTIRLSNGQTFDTTVSPEHLKPIMNAFAEAHVRGGGSIPAAPPPAPVERTEAPVPLDDEAMREDAEFGGMSTFGGPPEAPARRSTIATGPVPTTVTRPAPAKTVARNEAGYPVLAGGVDPSRVLGDGPDTDEDGVAQA